MRSRRAAALLIFGMIGIAIVWFLSNSAFRSSDPVLDVTEKTLRHDSELTGVCPWRDAKADRARYFPTATETHDEMLALGRQRRAASALLGRSPTAEESLLRVHRLERNSMLVGTIVTRCLRGEAGVIELVLAVDAHGKVCGAHIQRMREPDETARLLRSRTWYAPMIGKDASADWFAVGKLSQQPKSVQTSARAVLEGIHYTLILLDLAAAEVKARRESSRSVTVKQPR